MSLVKGPEIVLGAEQLNERMHRFLLLHRRVLNDAGRPVAYIDARYANGLAVRFVETESEQQAKSQIGATTLEVTQTPMVARNDQLHLTGDERNGG